MKRSGQPITLEELGDIESQCAELHKDWHSFYQVAASPGDDAGQQHVAFIQLQSRLSCDYPVLSHWRKGNFGLSASIGKLVARAGTLEAFATEVHAGGGPLVQEWHEVNDAIVRVRGLLQQARKQAKAGKLATLPREIAAPKVREPLPVRAITRKAGIAGAILAGCFVVFLILRPFILDTDVLKWVDDAYTAWQIRNGLPGMTN